MTGLTDKELEQLLRDAQERADSYPFDDHILEVSIPALIAEVRRLRAAIAEADQIERWPYNPGTMPGFELDQAQGYNDALTEVNRALHPEGPDHD